MAEVEELPEVEEDLATEVVAVEEEEDSEVAVVEEAASIEDLHKLSSQLLLTTKLLKALCAAVSLKRRSHSS